MVMHRVVVLLGAAIVCITDVILFHLYCMKRKFTMHFMLSSFSAILVLYI
jgi:hypothetical protein